MIQPMKNIHLLGKKIIFDKSKLLLSYKPDEKWLDYWTPKSGDWEYQDGCLIGTETGNMGGIMLYKEYFDAPGEHRAHRLLHTSYVKRDKY